MSVMIQIRNVPETLDRKLKVRAAEASVSLSDYLLTIIRELGERPTMAEMQARLASLPPLITEQTTVEPLREERERA